MIDQCYKKDPESQLSKYPLPLLSKTFCSHDLPSFVNKFLCCLYPLFCFFYQCLSSSIAFGFGCFKIAQFEQQAVGVQWHNIWDSPMTGDDFSMMHIIIMMLVDALIYGLLTWYIEAVFPGQYGIPKPWYFFVLKSYWCGRRTTEGNLEEGLSPYFDPEGNIYRISVLKCYFLI